MRRHQSKENQLFSKLFTRLRENWNLLPQESSSQWSCYIPGNTEQPLLGNLRAELVRCATEVTEHKRGDNHEFVQLCLVFLDADGEEQTAVTFQRPGALHKARWMAKLLYTLKLALMEQHIALLPPGHNHHTAAGAEDSGICHFHYTHLCKVLVDLRESCRCCLE